MTPQLSCNNSQCHTKYLTHYLRKPYTPGPMPDPTTQYTEGIFLLFLALISTFPSFQSLSLKSLFHISLSPILNFFASLSQFP